MEVQKSKSEVQIQPKPESQVQLQSSKIPARVQIKSKSSPNQVQIPRSPKVQIGLGAKSKPQVQKINLGRSSSPAIWTSFQSPNPESKWIQKSKSIGFHPPCEEGALREPPPRPTTRWPCGQWMKVSGFCGESLDDSSSMVQQIIFHFRHK